MDGWVTIGTKLDTKELEKDLKRAEGELRRYETEAERLTKQKVKAETDLTEYERAKNNIRELTDESLKFAQTQNEVEATLKHESSMLSELDQKYSRQIDNLNQINTKIKQNSVNQGLAKNNIEQINQKLGRTKSSLDLANISAKNIGNSISHATNRVIRWGIAIFGIHSAYRFVSQAANELSQSNSKIGADIEYIRFALASMLLPVIQTIIKWIYKLLYYINYIAKAWFGVNLFANASSKAFEKAKTSSAGIGKNLNKATKEAKELRKQLAGFDEMNVLSDNVKQSSGGSGGAGGGGGDFTAPSVDLSKWQGEVPEWLKWIVDHKDLILAVLAGIAAALLAIKLGLSGIKALGIGIAVAGIVYAIQGLLAYLKDPSLENLGKIFIGLGVAVIGIAIAIGALPVAIVGAIILIEGLIIKHWNKIKKFLQKGANWLESKSKFIHKTFGDTIGDIYDNSVDLINDLIGVFDDLVNGIKKNFDGIIKIVKGVFTGDWKLAWEGIKQVAKGAIKGIVIALEGLIKIIGTTLKNTIMLLVGIVKGVADAVVKILKTTIDSIKNVFNSMKTWIDNNIVKPIGKFFSSLWTNIANGASTAVSKIKSFFNSIPNTFSSIVNKISKFFKNLGSSAGNVIGGAFKSVVNGVLRTIENVLNAPIRKMNSLIGTINSKLKTKIGKLGTFSLPRLAKGGIVNNPGRGVPIGGAIAGEAGAEGVIPLTDSQQMALLGEAIGRYITVNANITNNMNGRVISREIQKVQNQTDFATNR